jgi:protoheme IX farnesyltransferase
VIGWAAVTGGVSAEPLVLFGLIFLWTPPHFWALALFTDGEYARAGVPMLPVVRGRAATGRQILAYTLLLLPLAPAPWAMGFAGPAYGLVAAALGLVFVISALRVLADDSRMQTAAKKMFGFSILYLFLLFAMLIVDATAGQLV